MQMSDFIPKADSLRPSAGTSGYRSLGLALKETPIGSLAWRALGQAALIYLTIGASAVTAQDTQPGRTTLAEMIAFARLGSVACERVVPDAEGFHALALQRFINPPLTEKEIRPCTHKIRSNICSSPKATELPRDSGMTRSASCGRTTADGPAFP
jgi:hypothetical protein